MNMKVEAGHESDLTSVKEALERALEIAERDWSAKMCAQVDAENSCKTLRDAIQTVEALSKRKTSIPAAKPIVEAQVPCTVVRKAGRPRKTLKDRLASYPTNGMKTVSKARQSVIIPKQPVKEPAKDPNDPLEARAVEVGKTLIAPWTATDLSARLDGDSSVAYRWIAAWKAKGWIETVAAFTYRNTERFGV